MLFALLRTQTGAQGFASFRFPPACACACACCVVMVMLTAAHTQDPPL